MSGLTVRKSPVLYFNFQTQIVFQTPLNIFFWNKNIQIWMKKCKVFWKQTSKMKKKTGSKHFISISMLKEISLPHFQSKNIRKYWEQQLSWWLQSKKMSSDRYCQIHMNFGWASLTKYQQKMLANSHQVSWTKNKLYSSKVYSWFLKSYVNIQN